VLRHNAMIAKVAITASPNTTHNLFQKRAGQIRHHYEE